MSQVNIPIVVRGRKKEIDEIISRIPQATRRQMIVRYKIIGEDEVEVELSRSDAIFAKYIDVDRLLKMCREMLCKKLVEFILNPPRPSPPPPPLPPPQPIVVQP